MYRSLLIAAFIAGCATEDPATLPVPPRPVPLSQFEVSFAQATLNALQVPSFDQNREFCGLIGIDETGAFVASEPVRGGTSSCLPPEDIEGVTEIASYHTHGGYTPAFATEIPSYDDLRTDIEDGVDGYVSTPGGRFWFVDARAKEVRLICGPGCVARDPDFIDDPDEVIETSYTLEELDDIF